MARALPIVLHKRGSRGINPFDPLLGQKNRRPQRTTKVSLNPEMFKHFDDTKFKLDLDNLLLQKEFSLSKFPRRSTTSKTMRWLIFHDYLCVALFRYPLFVCMCVRK